jgi:hypothetical protein
MQMCREIGASASGAGRPVAGRDTAVPNFSELRGLFAALRRNLAEIE